MNNPTVSPSERYRLDGVIKFPVAHALDGYLHDADGNMVANIRGWGWIQYLPKSAKVHDAWIKFVVDAINEKAKRDGLL